MTLILTWTLLVLFGTRAAAVELSETESLAVPVVITSLSKKTHLVVSAGTIGTYTVDGLREHELPYLYFSSVSPAFYQVAQQTFASGAFSNATLNNASLVVSCNDTKNQERIHRVQPNGEVVVKYPAHQAFGAVCVSLDGLTYTATPITYEVLDIQLIGFAEVTRFAERPAGTNANEEQDILLPPEFVTYEDIKNPETLVTDISFTLGESGGVQVIATTSYYSSESSLGETWRTFALSPTISHVRFSLRPDCSSTPLTLLSKEVKVNAMNQNLILYYHLADVSIEDPYTYTELKEKGLGGIAGSSFSQPGSFFVCVAVRHDRAPNSESLVEEAGSSLSFTLVPGLSANLQPPTVRPRGMWMLSPQDSTRKVALRYLAHTLPEGERESVKVLVKCWFGEDGLEEVCESEMNGSRSTTEIRVPQHSSPIISLDVSNRLSEGMAMYLSPRPECSGWVMNANATLAVQHVRIKTFVGSTTNYENLPFIQLRSSHTVVGDGAQETRWYICLSSSAFLPARLLPGWSFVVYKESFPSSIVSETIVTLPKTFSGFLSLPSVDTSLWSSDDLSRLTFGIGERDNCSKVLSRDLHLMQPPLSNTGETKIIIPPGELAHLEEDSTYSVCVQMAGEEFISTGVFIFLRPRSVSAIGLSASTDNPKVRIALPRALPTLTSIRGYGLSASSFLFISATSCDIPAVRESVLNVSMTEPLSNHLKFTNESLFAVWPSINSTETDYIFTPEFLERQLCLFDAIDETVVPTNFSVFPERRGIMSIQNVHDDFALFSSLGLPVSTTGEKSYGVFGSNMVLNVLGVNLYRTEVIPAVNCSRPSTFLWENPVALRPNMGEWEEQSGVLRDALYFESSWQVHLDARQTLRGFNDNSLVYKWCARYLSDSEPGASDIDNFTDTNLTFQIVFPSFTGFLSDSNTIVHEMHLPIREQWHFLRLVGPRIGMLGKDDALSLHVVLIHEEENCRNANNSSSVLDNSVTIHGELAVNTSQLSEGTFRLCYSVVAADGLSSPYIDVPMSIMKVIVKKSFLPLITQFNGAEKITLVKQTPQTVVVVSGIGLTEHTVIQLVNMRTSCFDAGKSPLFWKNGIPLFRRCSLYTHSETPVCDESNQEYEAVFDELFFKGMEGGKLYKVCFQADADSDWLPSPVTVELLNTKEETQHVPRGYWTRNDIKRFRLLPETTRSQTMVTKNNITQIVLGANSVFSVFCGISKKAPKNFAKCPDGRRVMLAPLVCQRTEQGYCQFKQKVTDTIWGPFVIMDGLFTIADAASPEEEEWWSINVETKPGNWEQALNSVVFFSPNHDNQIGFSSVPQLPPPFNSTVVEDELFLERDTPKVSYLSGFNIYGEAKLRFGSSCEDPVTEEDMIGAGVQRSNFSYLIEYRQQLNNSLLYTNPIFVTDARGAFCLPESHLKYLQQRTAMCLSIDGGKTYRRTPLYLTIGEKRRMEVANRVDVDGLTKLYKETIVVARNTSGFIRIDSIPGVEKWNFSSDSTIHVAQRCHEKDMPNTPVLTRTGDFLFIPSEATARSSEGKEMRLCAVSPNGPNKVVTELGFFEVLGLQFILNSTSDDAFIYDGSRAAIPIRVERNEYATACSTKDPSTLFLCMLENDVSFLDASDRLYIQFSNNNCLPSATSAVYKPALLNDRGSFWLVTPIVEHLPEATLGGDEGGFVCISVDGGLNYLRSSIRYFTSGVSASNLLMLSLEGEEFSPFLQRLSVGSGAHFIHGSVTDRRCFSKGYHDLSCSRLAQSLWTGFFDRLGWAERGLWGMALPDSFDRMDIFFQRQGAQQMNVSAGVEIFTNDTEINCVEKDHSEQVFLQQSDGGHLTFLPPSCVARLSTASEGHLIRLPVGVDSAEANDPCLDVSQKSFLNLTFLNPGRWAVTDEAGLLISWPWTLRYAPDGVYNLCFSNRASNFIGTSLRVKIGKNAPIREIGGVSEGDVRVYQGTNTRLSIEGSVVKSGQSILVAFAPDFPRMVELLDGTMWLWDNGCSSVPNVFTPYGVSLLSPHQAYVADVLLTTPILEVSDGILNIPASSLRHVSTEKGFSICYSIDGGLTFEDVSEHLRLLVLPPTVTSSLIDKDLLPPNFILPSSTTSNALRVQYIIPNYPLLSESGTFITQSSLDGLELMTHPPIYYIKALSGFEGDGIGQLSGRQWNEYQNEINATAFIASVAIVNSSVVGSACSNINVTDDSLATPIFLLNLNTGGFFAEADIDATWNSELVKKTNPVLADTNWRRNTVSIREGSTTFQPFELAGEQGASLIVCLSLDGVRYYSANFLEDTRVEPSRFSHTKSGALILIPSSSVGTESARGLTLVLTVMARGLNCGEPLPTSSASAIQQKIGQELNLDASILVVQVQTSSCLPRLSVSQDGGEMMATFSVSVVVTADSIMSKYGESPKPSPIILYDVVETLLQPANLERVFSNTSLGVIGVQFFYSNGRNVQNVANFTSPLEAEWHGLFTGFSRDGLSVLDVVPEFEESHYPLQWYFMILTIVFPLLLILGSLIWYRKYLAY